MTSGVPGAQVMSSAELIGRAGELAELDRLFADARQGRCTVAVVSGPHGVGKSALLSAFRARHRDSTILLAGQGIAWEAGEPFGVLRQLLACGSVEADAVEGVVQEPLPTDAPGRTGEWLARWLTARASGSVALIVIDDAQFADRESLQALVSGLKRLEDAPVFAVFGLDREAVGCRTPGVAEALQAVPSRRLVLRGLGTVQLQALARGVGVELNHQAAASLGRLTGGLPGPVLDLLGEQDPTQWTAPHLPLFAPASVLRSVGEQLAGLDRPARQLVQAAAVLGRRTSWAEVVALTERTEPGDGVGPGRETGPGLVRALDQLCRVGLVRVEGDVAAHQIVFCDALTWHAVYVETGPLRRQELHRAASALVSGCGAQLWHQVAADPRSDEPTAAGLERCAEQEATDGHWADAARSLLLASRISPAPGDSDRRLYLGVEALIGAGDIVQALEYVAEMEARPSDALRDAALGYLALCRGRAEEAQRYLNQAWDDWEAGEGSRGRRLGGIVARHRVLDGLCRWDPEAMLDWSARSLDLHAIGVDELEAQAMTGLAHGMLGGLGQADHYERYEQRDDSLIMVGESAQWQRMRMARGWVELAGGEVSRAQRALESALPAVFVGGSRRVELWARAWLARAQFRLGDWNEALAGVEEAAWVVSETGLDLLRPLVFWTAVQVHAQRGDTDAAQQYLHQIERRPNRYLVMHLPARLAAADLAEASGDHESVVRTLRPVAAYPIEHPVNEPGYWPWAHRYADALVITGRLEEAAAVLALHRRRAEQRGNVAVGGQLAAAQGRLLAAGGDLHAAEVVLQEAIAIAATRPEPLDLAQLRYVAGQVVRRSGRRRDAEALLQDARRGYLALGSLVGVQRCEVELRAGGQRRDGDPTIDLTRQETTVAKLVASGLSNREVAAELFLSVKTVQFHLTRVYTKLGIRSRTELAVRLHDVVDRP